MTENDYIDPEKTVAAEGSSAVYARALIAGDIVGGNYKIKSFIGRGGMGVVYCAEHMAINRDVALKALAPDVINQSNWQRMQNEAKTVAMLDHPNVVKVYDMGTDGEDCLYYVMDLLQGKSLADLIKEKGVLELAEVFEIFQQLCAGLSYAHNRGLVHRDIKPTNIILLQQGRTVQVKIIDFGLVKMIGEASRHQQSQTAAGTVCGSPMYMSPEQSTGGKIDTRSDIYSLGCTLFECLTGRPPFRARTALATATMQQTERPPRLGDLLPEKNYPENLEELVGRMLEKAPTLRYQSMIQVAQDLTRVKQAKPISRQAVYSDKPLFEIDNDVEEKLSEWDRKTNVPLIAFLSLSTIVFLFVVWFVVSSWSAQNATKQTAGVWNAESEHARDVYEHCAQISNGLSVVDGASVRVFNFPDVSLGLLCWGFPLSDPSTKVPARGKVVVPADQPVILRLPRLEGTYTREMPQILTKFGAHDINGLELTESNFLNDEYTVAYTLRPDLLEAISKWKDLRELKIFHCNMSANTIAALDDLAPLSLFWAHNCLADGEDLARVKWLDKVGELDVCRVRNVDAVLERLAGSKSLWKIKIDRTSPSVKALRGLATCPNLRYLAVDDCEFDDAKLDAIAGATRLECLILRNDLTKKDALMRVLPGFKNLQYLDLVYAPIEQEDYMAIRKRLPHCRIVYEQWNNLDKDKDARAAYRETHKKAKD